MFLFITRIYFLPPKKGMREGIIRQTVLDPADDLGIIAKLSMFKTHEIKEADEVFITSAAGGVMPVPEVNGKPVAIGTPGKVTSRIRERYWEAHEEERWAAPVDYNE
jgi:branched-subunit amino acid aminotransferase/4-amino-4-deoxychorismate lyase